MDEFTAADRREEKFLHLLSEGPPDVKLYVYWAPDGRMLKPAILVSHLPFENLYKHLQDEYGGQWYVGMIRRRTMLVRHEFGIAQPLNSIPKKDIRTKLEELRRAERRKASQR